MKVPYSWLAEYCDPDLDAQELALKLAMSGTEVERVTRVGVPAVEHNEALFRVGQVLSAEQHPDADRLKVCSVQLAGSDMRTIVCGAPNVEAGQAVLVALPGAVLADGTKLGRATLRGVESDGMILSESEIQLGTDSSGIMVLPGSPEAGEEAARHVPLGDEVLELEVTPNRPDCLSVYGVAREVHAVTGSPLAAGPWADEVRAEGEGKADDLISVSVEGRELCPRFTVRVFTDVTVGPSPPWLKARLTAAGQRPINNVVDVTNYVMLLVGQPMHAYDLDRVAGSTLVVRQAKEGERLVTLDGEERCLDKDAVLVCDADGPSGIGGVMGGAASEVSAGTTSVALEAATWKGPNILKTSSKLGLRSEASTRFEKQLHPQLALDAQRVAAKLMVELCGARLVQGEVDVSGDPPAAERIRLRSERLAGLLGEQIEPDQSRAILERLGFGVEPVGGDLDVEVPYFRHFDVGREADLIEEVARIHGLENLPTTLPARERAIGGLTRLQRLRRLAEDILRGLGLSEAVSYSFISPHAIANLRLPEGDQRRRGLHIANPLSEDQSVMRTTLLPGLLDAARRNLAHDTQEVRLFETGRVFLADGPDRLPEERLSLALLLAGTYRPATWRSPEQQPDFYVGKGILVALLEALHVEWGLADGGPSFLHPGRAAEVLVGAHRAGYVGEVHPSVAQDFGLDGLDRAPAVLEFDLDLVLDAAQARVGYEDLITFPAVFEDVAVVVDEAVEAQTVIDTLRSGGGGDLRNVRVFDVYRGEQLGEGKKSLALRLEFRSADRTLTDEEVAARREAIKEALAGQIGGVLRE